MSSVPFILTHNVDNAHDADVFSVVACQRYTITASGDGKINLFNNQQPEEDPITLNMETHQSDGIHHLAIDASGSRLVATGFSGRVELYDLETLKQEKLQSLSHIKGAWSSAISANGQLLAVVSIDCHMTLIDLSEDKNIAQYKFSQDQSAMALSVDITADSSYIACGLDSGVVQIFSTETGRVDYTLPCLTMRPKCVKFSPNSSLLAVAGDSHAILLFSLNGGDLLCSLMGHTSWVFSLAWNPSGQLLLSASQDTDARVWSLEQQSCVATLTDSTKPLFCTTWLDKSWTANVIGGAYEGVITAGLDAQIRWYREAGQ